MFCKKYDLGDDFIPELFPLCKLSGMTGLAMTEAEEFQQVYVLDAFEIPPNRKLVRIDHDDLIYKTEDANTARLLKRLKNITKLVVSFDWHRLNC